MRSTALPMYASSHRRFTHDGRGIDGVFAVRDAGDVEDGIVIGRRIEAGVVTEGAFAAQLIELHISFKHVLRRSGDFEIDRLALSQVPQAAGAGIQRRYTPRLLAARGRWRLKVIAGSVPMTTATSIFPEGRLFETEFEETASASCDHRASEP